MFNPIFHSIKLAQFEHWHQKARILKKRKNRHHKFSTTCKTEARKYKTIKRKVKIGQNNENLRFLCLLDWARDCRSWTNMTFLYLLIYVHMLVFFCHMPCYLWIYFNDYDAWLVCMLDIGIHIVIWDSCLGSSKPQIFVWKYPSFAWKFLS